LPAYGVADTRFSLDKKLYGAIRITKVETFFSSSSSLNQFYKKASPVVEGIERKNTHDESRLTYIFINSY
jgi:hypothetical protein